MSLLGGAGRGAVVAATSVLALATLSLVPSASADTATPTADCPTAYTGAFTQGQTVNGLTVSSGTTPERFTGTVLGVLKQGVDSDTDMIIMNLDSPAIEDAGGIWEGMSGSPVYDDATGQLIGAVAFGLSDTNSPIAGITPYTAMERYLPKQTVPVPGRIAARISRAADVAPADAGSLEPLATPMSIGGVSAARERRAAQEGVKVHTGLATGRFGKAGDATGGTDDLAPASTLVAGGNMAAMLVWGDVAEGGIGTVTAVCDGGIVGFGHPLNGTGDAKVALMSADAVYVQPDLFAPFKEANLGVVAGTITQDRQVGISGTLGAGPAAAAFTSTASYRGSTRSGTSHAADPQFWADAAYGESVSNGDTVISATIPGSAATSYTITGTTGSGQPFRVTHRDHYLSQRSGDADIAGDVSWDLGNLLWGVGAIDGVHLTSVTMSADYNDAQHGLHISGLQQKVGGQWVTLGKSRPVLVRHGRTAHLRVVLGAPGAAPTYEPTTLSAPRRGAGTITIVGGNALAGGMFGESPTFHSVAALKKYVAGQVGHDQVVVGERVGNTVKRVVLGPLDRVARGHLAVPVVVR